MPSEKASGSLPKGTLLIEVGDAPPAYDYDVLQDRLHQARNEGQSTSHPHWHHSATSSVSASLSPSANSSNQRFGGESSSKPESWYSHALAANQVRSTILKLLRDLVKQHDSPHSATGVLESCADGVLESCADACKTYNLSLSSLLQKKSIEDHSPIYWAIVNRPPSPTHADTDLDPDPAPSSDLVSILLSHAAPLTDSTVNEVRLACLHASNHALFQRLRSSPEFAALSERDKLVRGSDGPVDEVSVEEVRGDEAAFVMKFRIPMFQKRMRVTEGIRLEFIAKGRLWELTFLVAQRFGDRRLNHNSKYRGGSWIVKLALLYNSPPTYIDGAYLVIEGSRTEEPDSLLEPQLQQSQPNLLLSFSDGSSSAQSPPPAADIDADVNALHAGLRPQIKVPLEALYQLTAPITSTTHDGKMIVVQFEEHAELNSLQFTGCPYLERDGSLVGRVEGRLARPAGAQDPSSDCIVC